VDEIKATPGRVANAAAEAVDNAVEEVKVSEEDTLP